MKNKLLNAMKSLPMTIEDKQEFVNTIVNNSKGGGEATLYHYKFDGSKYFKYLEETYDDDSVNAQIEATHALLVMITKFIWIHDIDEGRTDYLINALGIDSTEYYLRRIDGFIIENPVMFYYPYYTNGNFDELAETLITNPDFGGEELKPIFDNIKKYLTPVTKEEFYADFVTKPIIL